MVARRAHNPKVVGSNPAPATKFKSLEHILFGAFLLPPSNTALLHLNADTTAWQQAWLQPKLPPSILGLDIIPSIYYYTISDAGWSSMVARRAHNPKVVGSNPAPATKFKSLEHIFVRGFFYVFKTCDP